jgi:hypothetical protein
LKTIRIIIKHLIRFNINFLIKYLNFRRRKISKE